MEKHRRIVRQSADWTDQALPQGLEALSERVWNETNDPALYLATLRDEQERAREARLKADKERAAQKKALPDKRAQRAAKRAAAIRGGASRQERAQFTHDAFVRRADAFSAFVIIAETYGLPAHVIDEPTFARIIVNRKWDRVPLVLSSLINNHADVKAAFEAFSETARLCAINPDAGNVPTGKRTRLEIADRSRSVFVQAASAYARRLRILEASMDKLAELSVDELNTLAETGDDLSKRIAGLGKRISAELATRTAQKGGQRRKERYQELAVEAQKLARSMVPPSGRWRSRRQAVHAVLPLVLSTAKEKKIALSEMQAAKTLDSWLKAMSDASTLFASKQGTSAE
ncbi:hypothetical protein [Achromobacter aegrifaciens]